MDFTFLFLTVLMILAAQSGMLWIAVGIFLLLLLSAKSKWLLLAAGVSAVLTAVVYFTGIQNSYFVVGGMFIVLLLVVKKDADNPQPEGAMYGGYGGGY